MNSYVWGMCVHKQLRVGACVRKKQGGGCCKGNWMLVRAAHKPRGERFADGDPGSLPGNACITAAGGTACLNGMEAQDGMLRHRCMPPGLVV